MRIIIASDHVGFPLKHALLEYLGARGMDCYDGGPERPDIPVDYPDFAAQVAHAVTAHTFERGVLVCGTGIGMSIAANRVPGVRAALCHNLYTAHYSRSHNDANILCLGAESLDAQTAIEILKEWLNTDFENGRHKPKLAKLEKRFLEFPSGDEPSPLTGWRLPLRTGVAISPSPSGFGPLLFSGRLEEGFRAAHEAGFDLVELSLRSSQEVEPGYLAELLSENQLDLAAIATGRACLEDSLCLSSTDASVRARVLELIKENIVLASRFNAGVIIGGIRGRLTGSTEDLIAQRASAVAAIRECSSYAKEDGVMALIEPINRYETNFINTAAEGMQLLEEVGDEELKLLLDTFHMNIEETDLSSAILATGSQLGYLHFADSNRYAPGQGHLDFQTLMRTIEQVGYQGAIGVEILPYPDDLTAIRQAGSFLSHLLHQPTAGGDIGQQN